MIDKLCNFWKAKYILFLEIFLEQYRVSHGKRGTKDPIVASNGLNGQIAIHVFASPENVIWLRKCKCSLTSFSLVDELEGFHISIMAELECRQI